MSKNKKPKVQEIKKIEVKTSKTESVHISYNITREARKKLKELALNNETNVKNLITDCLISKYPQLESVLK